MIVRKRSLSLSLSLRLTAIFQVDLGYPIAESAYAEMSAGS